MAKLQAVTEETVSKLALDVEQVRAEFPILARPVRDNKLVFLDNAASTQKPQVVIDRIKHFYEGEYANIHRGVYWLSQKATEAYEAARTTAQKFIKAADAREIIFTRSTTESINLVAHSFVRPRLKAGDEILITGMEHHSNIVPWQLLCEETGAQLKVVPLQDDGTVLLEDYEKLLNKKTRFVSLVHVSNVLGTINPIETMIQMARAHQVPILIDGAQAAPHVAIDVQALDCDFYAFSGHKTYGPTGIGALYGKYELLEAMGPYQGGGDMIESVTFEKTTFQKPPQRFEAGTPNIAGTIGFATALDFVSDLGLANIAAYEAELHRYACEALQNVQGLRFIGTAPHRAAVVSFVLDGIHPHDVGTILDQEGVAVRAGHHCAQPVMQHYGVAATVRASFACYTTFEEIDALVAALNKVSDIFR